MKVYDEVNNLAKAIKESQEYLEYKEIKNILFEDPEMKKKVEEFEKIRYEEQLLAMQGEEQSKEKMNLINLFLNEIFFNLLYTLRTMKIFSPK